MDLQKNKNFKNLKLGYFGGEPLGVPVLQELEKVGILPELVVCNPDRPVGRKHILTPPSVKVWAEKHDITVLQPTILSPMTGVRPLSWGEEFENKEWDLFVVVAYNHILPKWLLDIPKYGTVNLHPSLLPLLRGASPIRTAILNDMRAEIGVSVMLLDEKMDHGPIIAQEKIEIAKKDWPIHGIELDSLLAKAGGSLLATTLPKLVAGSIKLHEQDHTEATYCGKLDRSMGELKIDPYNLPSGEEAYQNLLKIRAFDGFPGTFFMYQGKRIKITDAELAPSGKLRILTIIPEGKKDTDYCLVFGNNCI